jgi:hypothetical protein
MEACNFVDPACAPHRTPGEQDRLLIMGDSENIKRFWE